MVENKHIFGLVKLYAVVLARYHWNDILKGGRVVFFVDNIPSMRSLIKGTSTDKQWRWLLRSIELVEMEGPTHPRSARGRSDSNIIADGPSIGMIILVYKILNLQFLFVFTLVL